MKSKLMVLAIAVVLLSSGLVLTSDTREEWYSGSSISSVSYDTPTTDFPSRFDLRDVDGRSYVTPVVDQSPYGTFWAFASIAAMETGVLALGEEDVDLSEVHQIYFTYNKTGIDPKGGLDGDIVTTYGNSYVNFGASMNIINSIATWSGPADEETVGVPYEDLKTDTVLDPELQYDSAYHLKGVYQVSSKDTNSIKYLMSTYNTGMKLNFTLSDDMEGFRYVESEGTYCYYDNENKTHNNGHAVTLVGWDDDYPAENFGKDSLTTDGAWLIKNSWGDDWGNGYFWMSYKTIGIRSMLSFPIMSPADDYVYSYQYDGGLSSNQDITYGNVGYMSNVFTATGDEDLTAVSMWLLKNSNVGYSIQVYVNPTDPKDPTSGTPAFENEVTGTTTYIGYYTVDLPEKVSLSDGDKFSVVIRIQDMDQGDVYIPVDTTEIYKRGGLRYLAYYTTAHSGESLVSSDGVSWKDISSDGHSNVRIKAFTDERSES